ncbi:hypothetical protein [Actinocorallia sp. A-T 12471]|uniref:hypothetical protein n=1 Tax=Actinocorallia sp. A-T 12471 TaxID=3089813 RepID=UPI0029D2A61D|nr:hypothetical protein [Actinocorallia sp. A-T 12471]MDX6739157.1 hypothetical protein [Actinocorallia sp. A-T 12471]
MSVEREARHQVQGAPGQPGATGPGDGVIRLAGLALVAGPLIWAAGQFAGGVPESDDAVPPPVEMITGCAFLVGLAALAAVMLASRATGDRKGKALPIIALVLFPIAIICNLGSIPYDTYEEMPLWVAVTDPAWPLSQLMMIVSAVAVIRVARWKGPLRFLPLAGALWVIFTAVGEGFTGPEFGPYIFTAWMVCTYVAAGALIVAKPAAVRGV